MTWELLPVFDGWEYGNQNRENHLFRVMWLSFWSSHLNAGGHLLFLSWDPSYDPLPTILGLWVFHEASLGAPCPLGNRGLCHFSASPSYLTVGKWLEMDLESKQGLLKTQGTAVLGRQNVACVVPGLGFWLIGHPTGKPCRIGFRLLTLEFQLISGGTVHPSSCWGASPVKWTKPTLSLMIQDFARYWNACFKAAIILFWAVVNGSREPGNWADRGLTG